MTVRSKRLVDPVLITTGASQLVYTVPAGATALVKSVRMVNTSGSPVQFTLLCGPSPAAGVLFADATVPAGSIVTDSSWFVLEADDELVVQADTDNVLWVTASGAELEGAP